MASEGSGICCSDNNNGINFATPKDAIQGPREKVLFLTCPNYDMPIPSLSMNLPVTLQPKKPDAIISVDVDPESPTYCQFLCQLDMPKMGDEIHHTGWNACAGCFGQPGACRRFLICPTLLSSEIYVIDTLDPKRLKIHHTVKRNEIEPHNATFLHTSHCLPDGQIMISSLGDNKGDNLGQFLLLDQHFKVIGKWNTPEMATKFGYAFWYQPRLNVMISTGWGSPNAVVHGFKMKHLEEGLYGNSLYIWNWKERRIIQEIKLEGEQGLMPFEIRFMHEPTSSHAYFATAHGSSLYHVYKRENDSGVEEWKCDKIEVIPKLKVKGWILPEMPGLITDNIISMDDKYLYLSLWFHGEIRQYDISDPFVPVLVGRIQIGGLLHNKSNVVCEDPDFVPHNQTMVKGKTIHGAPHALQLSLDGKRLYTCTSINTPWDEQFYPDLVHEGAAVILIHVDNEQGGLTLDPNFVIDLGSAPRGTYGCHHMRYPGGDCTSDIWT